ncbi:MAG: hypothetical protein ABI132_09595 [Rhodanobacteraceae bacterium]
MPTVNPDFNRSVVRLDTSAERSGIFTADIDKVEFSETALRRFNDVAKKLDPAFAPISIEQIAGAVRRVLRAAVKGHESLFIKLRMRRAEEIRALLADPTWTTESSLRARMQALIAYFDDPDHLIRAGVPGVDHLDDALLVDITMESLRAELDEYAEYRRFRANEAARLDIAPSLLDIDRERWSIEHAEELRLERQLHQVRSSNYSGGAMEQLFRVR